MMKKVELRYNDYLFDFDGTLVDTSSDVIDELKKAYIVVANIDVEIKKEHVGPPLHEMIRNITPSIDAAIIPKIVDSFRASYKNCGYVKSLPYVGVKDLLELVTSNNGRCHVVTNKPYNLTTDIIAKTGLHFFSTIITPDSQIGKSLTKSEMVVFLIESKLLDPTKCLMVGDMPSDISAAKNQEVVSVAFLGGYGTRDDLLKSDPTYTIQDISELQAII